MPGGDRTGPAGAGPMSGRQAGYCAGYDAPGYANVWPGGWGRGFGWRGGGFGRRGGWFGGGRGWRHRFYATGVPGWAAYGPPYPVPPPPTREQEIDGLKAHAEYLQEELRRINERIDELEQEE